MTIYQFATDVKKNLLVDPGDGWVYNVGMKTPTDMFYSPPFSLYNAQKMVHEFHAKFGALVRDKYPNFAGIADTRVAHSASLVEEESRELCDAVSDQDLPGAVDALADIIYVCLGAAVTWGVDMSPIFRAVHTANMAKTGGSMRADGKILKPDGWVAPDISGELRKQGWRSDSEILGALRRFGRI